MSWSLRRRFNPFSLAYILDVHLNSPIPRIPANSMATLSSPPAELLGLSNYHHRIPISRFTTSSNSPVSDPSIVKAIDFTDKDDIAGQDSESDGDDDDNDNDNDVSVTSEDDDNEEGVRDETLDRHIGVILDILRSQEGPTDVRDKLDHCGISASPELVIEVLTRTRNDWEVAFMFFLWAGKQSGYVHSLRVYHSMISILAKRRKFDTAWLLIDEMQKGRRDDGESPVTINTLLIMIRRYCAVHDVGSAINAFHAMKRFGFHVGIDEFQKLLSALCRYKNVQDAEHLLFSNRNSFPFETKSFNIVLNGWCNVIGSPREGQRFWKVMIERRVKLDVVSYSSIISSYSKSNKLKDVLRLYDRMKGMGIAPDRKVYNAVIHALAKGGLVKEALNLLKAMEKEGIAPNTVTYNSLIKPLSRVRKREDAQIVFDEMLRRKLQPSVRTFHALLRMQRNAEDIYVLLDKMKETDCEPTKDTYMMLIRKFCRWGQLDSVFKMWGQMNERGLNDDSSSYIVLIHGLFLNSKLEEAHRVYLEMKDKSLIPDVKTDEMIQTWLANKEMAELPSVDSGDGYFDVGGETAKPRVGTHPLKQERYFQKRPEARKVVKQRGFSFWK